MPAKRRSARGLYDTVAYPLAFWIVLMVLSVVAGQIGFISLTTQILFGNGVLYLGIIFGLWVGVRASSAGGGVNSVILPAVVVAVVSGIVGVVLSGALVAYSQGFLQYVSQYISTTQGSAMYVIVSTGVATWMEGVILLVASAALAFEACSRR